MGALQGRLSGIALPKLIVDTPGGFGKVPVGRNYIVDEADGVTTLETFRAHPQAAAIEVHHLEAISPAIRKDEEMAGEEIEVELALDDRR